MLLGLLLVLLQSAPAYAAGTPAKRAVTYAQMVAKWHAAVPRAQRAPAVNGRVPLVLEVINTNERVTLQPLSDDGGFAEEDRARGSHALRDTRSDEEISIDPRVFDLAYRIQQHFDAGAIRVISGYRAATRGRLSNHARGRAIDLVVPGVSNDRVAQYARGLGFVGVGVYTRSGFLHIDSRPRSYFWVDGSGPGRPSRTVRVLTQVAARADARALARGETPPSEAVTEVEAEADSAPAETPPPSPDPSPAE